MGSVIIDGAEFVLKKKDGTSLGVLTTTDDSVDISEKGSKSHGVAPVTFYALHWVQNGEDRFSKGHMVHIPAKHFIEKSIKEVEPKTDDYFKLAIQEVLG